jgi:hypothetical protein
MKVHELIEKLQMAIETSLIRGDDDVYVGTNGETFKGEQ